MNYLDFDIGKAITSTYDSDQFPGIQIDAMGEKKSGVPPYEQHSPSGLLSRPHDCDVDASGNYTQGCTVLYAMSGSVGHAWVSHDPRVVPLLPALTKGGVVLYGGKLKTPSYVYVNGDTGSQTTYIPYAIVNGVATKAMSIQIHVDDAGDEHISIIHGEGMSISMIAGAKHSIVLKNKAGDGYLEVNDDGVNVNGTLTVHGSVISGVGGAGKPAAPLVRAPEMKLVIENLVNQVAALATIVAGITAVTVGAPAGALVAPIKAISGQLATIAAKNTAGV